MATTKLVANGGQARNNWTNQPAILSAKSLHVQSQTGSGLDCLEKQRCAVFAEIAQISRRTFLFGPRKHRKTEQHLLLPWFCKICNLYFGENFEWREENMPAVRSISCCSFIFVLKLPAKSSFVNDYHITGMALRQGFLFLHVSYLFCTKLCKHLWLVADTQRGLESSQKSLTNCSCCSADPQYCSCRQGLQWLTPSLCHKEAELF